MRVLIIHNLYRWRGGEDAVALRLRDMLQARGHTVEYLLADSQTLINAPAGQRLRAAAETLYSPASAARLAGVLDRFQPDVVHIFNVFPLLSPSVFWLLHQRRVPTVNSIANFRVVCPNGFAFTRGQICFRCRKGNTLPAVRLRCCHGDLGQSALYALTIGLHRWVGTFGRRMGHLLPVNSLLARVLREEYPEAPITVLPNCIDTTQYVPREGFRPAFTYLGRLFPEKGVDTLIEAARHVPEAEFHIVGDGPAAGQLKQQAEAAAPGRIIFHGYRAGEARLETLRRSMALVIASKWHEPCPLVAFEAMALGVPVVGARVGGLPDLVEDGVNGLLFEAGQAEALAERLRRLVAEPALVERMGRASRERAVRLYDDEAHCRRLVDIYAQTVEQTRAS